MTPATCIQALSAAARGRSPSGGGRPSHRFPAEATIYFSDLTHDYVTLNAEYST